jgi:tRNA pseudouridine55 synthase
MNGFFLADKPKGITSFYCVKILRRLSGVRRIGFVGTLDPLATGLMIFAFGEATKLIPLLEKSDKVYSAVIRLGAESDTYDADGKIREIAGAKKPSKTEIEKVLKRDFHGSKEQTPPAFSAVKVKGRRAYDLARKGQKIKMNKRKVRFFAVRIESYKWPLLKINVHCGSGTYVRSMAHDLGAALRCGGYVLQLRRIKIGDHDIKDAVPVERLDDAGLRKKVKDARYFFHALPKKKLSAEEYEVLGRGGSISAPGYTAGQAILGIYRQKCAGLLECADGKLKFRRKFNIIGGR